MSVICRFTVIAIAMVLAHVYPVWAQDADPSLQARHRNNCRLAAQVLETGHPHTHRRWALGRIAGCAVEGPVVLASLWRGIPAGDEVAPLVRASLRLRDARLYQQLRETAIDRSRPGEVRAAAMLVLTRYTNRQNAVWLSDLVPPDSITRIRLVNASTIGFEQVQGSSPLNEPIAAPILALLDGIAAARATEDRVVWYAAAVLAKRLRQDIDSGSAY